MFGFDYNADGEYDSKDLTLDGCTYPTIARYARRRGMGYWKMFRETRRAHSKLGDLVMAMEYYPEKAGRILEQRGMKPYWLLELAHMALPE